jgi:DNA-binding IclR family transcriptional regulator
MAKEHRTVSRVTTILEAAAASANGINLAKLAALLGAPKSSVHGLVKGLVANGYLQESNGMYTIGPAVAILSSFDQPSVLVSARRSLHNIQSSCNESATLCTLVGTDVVYVERVESTQMIRYSAPLRVRRPIYPTSAGKCFLANMTVARRAKLISSIVAPEDVSAAMAGLEEVARNGFATNRGETVADVYAVASPIVISGRAVACLQVAGPGGRMAAQMDSLADLVRSEAQRLSSDRT